MNYDVPAGDGAWFVSAGGGPCSALGSAEEVVGVAQAWAVTYKREVGGQVTVEGSAAPAPGITINANCPSGGTTATSANGYYDFLLDKGTCTIAPELQPGDTSTPVQRVLDVTTDINNVNFLVPCDAVPLGTGGGSTDGAFRPALASSATGPCRLIVSATPIDGGRSGLSLINSTATFLADADDLQGACASGCTDVKVTVTDAQGKAVEGATGVAHFTAVPPSDVAPREHGPTFGLVCHLDQVRDADGKLIALNETDACSSGAADETQMTISGTTDTKGQVFFRYWVPGLIGDASVKVSITATARGGGCGCFVRTGHGATGFGEKPYLLFDRGPVAVPEKTAVWLPIYAATHNGVAVTLASTGRI